MALLRSGRIERQNDPFPGFYESFSTLNLLFTDTAKARLPSIANGRTLNEPALCCIFAVSVPTFN